MKSATLSLVLLLFSIALQAQSFDPVERQRIVQFWSEPGRYTVTPLDKAGNESPWKVRLSPEGAAWRKRYQAITNEDPIKLNPDVIGTKSYADWHDWVKAQAAFDRQEAVRRADASNTVFRRGQTGVANKPSAPLAFAPGRIPIELERQLGTPPPFWREMLPKRYEVVFPGEPPYRYEDSIYTDTTSFLSANGVRDFGTKYHPLVLPKDTIDALFDITNLTQEERLVVMAVSTKEGGFDAINTYDSGYVSVGFLQFIAHANGNYSLKDVLRRHRGSAPAAFERDFRRYGIDLTRDETTIAVVNPTNGQELNGAAAVRAIIEDKRLTAVFQRAGQTSNEFRAAQVWVAYQSYWPGKEVITLENGQRVRVSDIIKTPQAMTNLMDTSVNKGRGFFTKRMKETLDKLMRTHQLTNATELATYETQISEAMVNRKYSEDDWKRFLARNTQIPRQEMDRRKEIVMGMDMGRNSTRILEDFPEITQPPIVTPKPQPNPTPVAPIVQIVGRSQTPNTIPNLKSEFDRLQVVNTQTNDLAEALYRYQTVNTRLGVHYLIDRNGEIWGLATEKESVLMGEQTALRSIVVGMVGNSNQRSPQQNNALRNLRTWLAERYKLAE